DNASAVKPFGAIDTPTQGGTASGTVFYNFGWVLTPPPNSIPVDGTTIWVWVDGVPLAHPSYGHYRDDIATQFPGYLNSNGAIGVYELNTTGYEDGVHTIVWSARDTADNEDGIGSRYFQITNGAFPAPDGAPAAAALPPAGGWEGVSLEKPEPAGLTIEELGRVRIRLQGPVGARFLGWGRAEGLPLPIGSTLRPETGEFFWIPGPGFLGEHVLHFAVTDGVTRSLPLRVTIRIVPKTYPRRPQSPVR
ncbi:MAG: hypothetical protein NTZ26_00015, partial [Candidatus Aminicenantes bacterium]|nr:hypothetical protein [Candidatus Aminicenantes bacterium]